MSELTATGANTRTIANGLHNAAEQPRQQYLSFMLQGRCYALDGLSVREIIQYGRPTKVPMVSPCIHGVINLRGAVVPVIDLGLRFALAKTQVDRRTCIIIVEVSDAETAQTLGILVDAVSEVLEVLPDEMNLPPAFGNPIPSAFIQAMVNQQHGFIIVLNIENALAVAEIAGLADGNNALTA